MAENITLARPYADAAFQLARATNALGPWQQALDRMAAVAADAQMVDCISNPRLLPAQVSDGSLRKSGPSSAPSSTTTAWRFSPRSATFTSN